jgi:hypothetical protein
VAIQNGSKNGGAIGEWTDLGNYSPRRVRIAVLPHGGMLKLVIAVVNLDWLSKKFPFDVQRPPTPPAGKLYGPQLLPDAVWIGATYKAGGRTRKSEHIIDF